MIKSLSRTLLSIVLVTLAAGPAQAIDTAGLPEPFKKNVPSELRDGLKLVELKKRCEDCAPWRVIEYRDNQHPQPVKQEKVSVAAGYTAMYAFPGTDYFANTKIEQSAPGNYDKDRGVIIDAIKHEYARKKERVAEYLRDNPTVKERVESLVPKGKDPIEFEEASYKGVEYVSYIENAIGLNGATISELHFFVPKSQIIVTAYLLKQQKAKFRNIDEFLKMRRDFIEGYIDFLSGQ